ncbi:hypothetical protein SRHO_G00306360 [Serrasalmus rhombeus]
MSSWPDCMSLDCGRKPTQTDVHGENMQTPHREDPGHPARESNPGPPRCEATALPTAPPYLIYIILTHNSAYKLCITVHDAVLLVWWALHWWTARKRFSTALFHSSTHGYTQAWSTMITCFGCVRRWPL